MRTGHADQSDTRQLRALLDHDLQRSRQRRLERQLHVGEELARAAHKVSNISLSRCSGWTGYGISEVGFRAIPRQKLWQKEANEYSTPF